MKVKNIKQTFQKPCILVAPLDWGLGHTTRCIPLIKLLLEAETRVLVAAEDSAAALLKKEFPHLEILPLKGYKVHYNRNNNSFLLKMFSQLPKMIAAIRHENKWLKTMVAQHQIDAVISDNRYGCYHKQIPSIFITHQLRIQTGWHYMDSLIQQIHYKFINRFNACWVPDMAGEENMAGNLSHPGKLPSIPTHYLGILSRCTPLALQKKYNLAVVLSGPEPQRSILESLLLTQLKQLSLTVIFIRGLPGKVENKISPITGITIVDHLPADEINIAMQSAEIVLARAGYSTIMDLMAMQQKAILIPTPQQTEQEYLAHYLMDKKIFLCFPQKQFSLQTALKKAENFTFSTLVTVSFNKEPVLALLSQLKN